MANKQLVLAFFNGEAAADVAVSALQEWDKASKEIKLGAIGILVKDDEGKIKTQKLGPRHTGTGVVVGAIAGLLTGGLSIIGGAVLGGIAGAFFHKGLGLSKEDLARIDGELDGGKAAVAVLADAEDAEAVSARLAESGGQPETYEVTEEAIEEATAATEAAAESVEEAAPEESEESA
jgi:uncharacterized membrane protein